MKLSAEGIALIKKFEGFSATAYLCPAGKWTIGYGHLLPSPLGGGQGWGHPRSDSANNAPLPTSPLMGEEDAEKLLKDDLAPVEAAINRLVTVPLTQNQFDALCSLTYNIGVGAFAGSTLLKLLNLANQRHATTNQFHRWIYGGGKVLSGLVARRRCESELFEKQ